MQPDPPLNGEFMRDSSPLFDWEVQSIEKRQAWGAGVTRTDGEAEAVQEARLHGSGGPTLIELVLQKLASEQHRP